MPIQNSKTSIKKVCRAKFVFEKWDLDSRLTPESFSFDFIYYLSHSCDLRQQKATWQALFCKTDSTLNG